MTMFERFEALARRVEALEDKLTLPVLIVSEPPREPREPLADPEPCSCDESVMLKAELREALAYIERTKPWVPLDHQKHANALLAGARVALEKP